MRRNITPPREPDRPDGDRGGDRGMPWTAASWWVHRGVYAWFAIWPLLDRSWKCFKIVRCSLGNGLVRCHTWYLVSYKKKTNTSTSIAACLQLIRMGGKKQWSNSHETTRWNLQTVRQIGKTKKTRTFRRKKNIVSVQDPKNVTSILVFKILFEWFESFFIFEKSIFLAQM